jgi:hypothetical protein
MAKTLKTSATTPRSGEHKIRAARGAAAGKEFSSAKHKSLPPAPKAGQRFTIESKSGRYIIASPAKSANTVNSWSDAFKAN